MHVVELPPHLELSSIHWNDHLTSKEKLNILRTLFGGTLDKVNFWDLYGAIKKLKSH